MKKEKVRLKKVPFKKDEIELDRCEDNYTNDQSQLIRFPLLRNLLSHFSRRRTGRRSSFSFGSQLCEVLAFFLGYVVLCEDARQENQAVK